MDVGVSTRVLITVDANEGGPGFESGGMVDIKGRAYDVLLCVHRPARTMRLYVAAMARAAAPTRTHQLPSRPGATT